MESLVVAVLLGIVQGVLEWVPVSSEGAIALAATFATDASPDLAAKLALFLHAGTAFAALAYYRRDVGDLLGILLDWRPRSAFDADTATLSFLAIATVTSMAVGGAAYFALIELVSAVAGGTFLAIVGVLLLGTGTMLHTAESRTLGDRETPNLVDAFLIGALQGLAILPGISRSGMTVGGLLLRGHAAEGALRHSFLLSIPAAFGAGVLVVLDEGGMPGISLTAAVLALATSAVVGYLTVDALVKLVSRLSFGTVCLVFGGLAVIGGGLLVL
jgi:undecaprenyl-diphosphatase